MAEIVLHIKVDTANSADLVDKLKTALSNLEKGAGNVKPPLSALDDVFTKIGLRMGGITMMFRAVQGSLGNFVRESNAGEEASAKLAQALKNQGIYSEQLVNDIKRYTTERQAATGIDDDATVAIAGQLTAMGLRGKALKDAIDATQDLSAVMRTDLNNAARLVGAALTDGGEELKRYGISLSDIRGQAEILGNTGSGAIQKFNATISDLQQSFGDLIKEGLLPIVETLNELAQSLNKASGSVKLLALGAASLIAMYAAFNTSAGLTPYLIVASFTAIASFIKAVDEGNSSVIIFVGAVAGLGVALAIMNANGIMAAVSGLGVLTKALISATIYQGHLVVAVGAATAAINLQMLAIGGIVGAVIALGAVLFAKYKQQEAQEKQHKENLIKSTANYVSETIDELSKLPRGELILRLNFETESTEKTITQIKERIEKLKQSGADEKEIKSQQDLLYINEQRLAAFKNMSVQISENDKKLKNSKEIQLALEKARIDTMAEGVNKAKASANLEYETFVESKRKELNERKITVEQFNQFEKLAKQKLKNELINIAREQANEELKIRLDYQKEAAQITLSARKQTIDYFEMLSLNSSKTEEERLEIKRDYAIRRIQVEYDAALQILNIEEELNKSILESGSETEKKRAEVELKKIQLRKSALKTSSETKKDTAEVEYKSGVAQLPQAGSIAKQYELLRQAEEEYNRATTDSARESAKKKVEAIQDTIDALEDEKNRMADLKEVYNWVQNSFNKLAAAKDKDVKKSLAREKTEQEKVLDNEKEKRLARARSGAEKQKIEEEYAAKKSALDDQMAVKYQEQMQTTWKIQKAFAIAEATVSTYEMATKAYSALAGIPIVGPVLGAIAAAAAVALGLANIGVIQSTEPTGFAKGGKVTKPTLGLIGENKEPEIIAPERTFLRVFREELMPKMILGMPAKIGTNNYILEREMKLTRKAIEKIKVINKIDSKGITTMIENQQKLNKQKEI